MISSVWQGDEPVNQPWGPTAVTVEPIYRGGHWHCGIDVGSPACKGKPLFAARAGTVTTSVLGILGVTVAGGQTDWYVHGEYSVSWKAAVAAGQQIGVFSNIVPRGGASTGPHLHFEVQPPGGWINVPPALDPVPILASLHGGSGGTTTGGNELTPDQDKKFESMYAAVGDGGPQKMWEQIKAAITANRPTAELASIEQGIADIKQMIPAAGGGSIDLTVLTNKVDTLAVEVAALTKKAANYPG